MQNEMIWNDEYGYAADHIIYPRTIKYECQ